MPGHDWQIWQILIAAFAGLVTIVVGFRTFFWRRMQMRSWLLNEQFQSDSHTLKLCQALSDASPRLRLAAAALLFERLKQSQLTSNPDRERSAIVQALLAATVGGSNREENSTTSPELCKYIADSVAATLGAMNSNNSTSPLKTYYWQRVQLTGAYWAGIDAREVDFFGANFDGASLRRANLQKAKFYDASLVGAKLSGSDLRDADFRGADLRDANLQDDDRKDGGNKKTEWSGIRLDGAKYNANTKFPAGLDPKAVGMLPVEPQPIREVA